MFVGVCMFLGSLDWRTSGFLCFEAGIRRKSRPSLFLAVNAMANVEREWVSSHFVLDSAAKTRTVFGGHGWFSLKGKKGI